MTREEAIKTLKENYCAICAYGSQNMDSCDIRSCDNKDAIKALEQEPCGDAVSRLAVLDRMKERDEELSSICPKDIKDLPPVIPQQNMGKWKAFTHSAYHGNDEDGEPVWREVTVYHCNLCNRRTVIKEKYCPNCGCKMQGVEE